jgi:hypothetical protein
MTPLKIITMHFPRESKNGGIAAHVGEIPYIKLFLAEHCMGYTTVRPIYRTAGFGYVSLTVFINFITLGEPSSN